MESLEALPESQHNLDMPLCKVCQRFDLKALILATEKRFKTPMRTPEGKPIFGNFQFALDAGLMFEHHGSMLELKRSAAACRMCAELWRCFSESAGLPEDEVDSQLHQGLCATRVYLVFSKADWQDDHLPKLIAMQRSEELVTRIIACFDVCAEAGLGAPSGFPGRCARLLFASSGSSRCMLLAKVWLQNCAKEHKSCMKPLGDAALPTRVIDVRAAPRLVDGDGRIESYIALSYSWGGESATMLTNETDVVFRQQLPDTALPPTMADTIAIARALDIPYVWIDALCIFQDSLEDFLAETANMGQIYKGATLTVHGSSAAKITDKLFETRDCHTVRLPWLNQQQDGEFVFLREDSQATTFHTRSCPLNSRGWCLQESLLATRSLWIGKRQLLFVCAESQAEEATAWLSGVTESYRDKKLMQQLTRHENKWFQSRHYRAWGMPPVFGIPYLSCNTTSLLKHWDLSRALSIGTHLTYFPSAVRDGLTVYDLWRSIVGQYTTRQFTRATDVFSALSGLADAFHRATGERFLAGLWEGDVIFSLNWDCHLPARSPVRRVCDEVKEQGWRTAHSKAGYLAPSWSWASIIQGNILFGPLRHGRGTSQILCNFETPTSARLVDAWTTLATRSTTARKVNPYGDVCDGVLVLRVPFILTTDPAHPPSSASQIRRVEDYIHHECIDMQSVYSHWRFEYDVKHRPYPGQQFGLIRTAVYQDRRSNAYPLSVPFQPDVSTHLLLIESCEGDAGDRGFAGDPPVKLRWRRLGHFELAEKKGRAQPAEIRSPIYRNQDVMDDLAQVPWREELIYLV